MAKTPTNELSILKFTSGKGVLKFDAVGVLLYYLPTHNTQQRRDALGKTCGGGNGNPCSLNARFTKPYFRIDGNIG